MSGVCYGKDYDYASSRLNNTIVRLKGEPVYVLSVEMDGVWYKDSSNKKHKTSLEDFDLTPVPLGYVNYVKNAKFVSRKPQRYYKQGLCYESINNANDGPCCDSVYMTILGIFPSLDVCVDRLLGGCVKSVAFSRDFALELHSNSKFNLLYRGKKVGNAEYNKVEAFVNIKLEDEYSFLEEVLEKCVND